MLPRWLFWTLLTLLSWGIWAILSKQIGDQLSPAHSQVLSTTGLIPIIAALWRARGSASEGGRRRRGIQFALGSGIVSSVGNIAFYQMMSGGAKAATAVAVTALAPLVTILLAVLMLRERLNRLQCLGIGCSLVAIYLFNVPDEHGMLSRWLVVALIPIGLWGLAGFLQKLATNHISGPASALWFLLAFLPVAVVIAVWQPLPATIAWHLWGMTAAVGFTLALGNYTILLAFASGGKASIIAPMAGLYPLISTPIAIFALHERVSQRESLGIGLAMLAVAAIACESPVIRTNPSSTSVSS